MCVYVYQNNFCVFTNILIYLEDRGEVAFHQLVHTSNDYNSEGWVTVKQGARTSIPVSCVDSGNQTP